MFQQPREANRHVEILFPLLCLLTFPQPQWPIGDTQGPPAHEPHSFLPKPTAFIPSAFGSICLGSPSLVGPLDNSYTPFKAFRKYPLLSIRVYSESLFPTHLDSSIPPSPRCVVYSLIVLLTLCMLLIQSCLTLCDPVDCSPPGSSVLGISQAGILEWVVISFSWGSSQPRD